MKLLLVLFITLLFFNKSISQPKLVIGIVVDQMRYDYLAKYRDQYSQGGFKRFYREGYVNANHNYNYVPTFTGPGHASIYTGTTPAFHGIIGNDWYDKSSKKIVYCAQDSNVTAVGSASPDSRRSPVLMRTTTIGDQLRFHTSMQSKVIGIALKDRGAILPAGHRANAAFWFNSSNGDFITSSYYMNELPAWVNQFNARALALKYLDNRWDLLLPASKYPEPDDLPYEKPFKGQTKSVFPYDLRKLKADNGTGVIASTPYGNTLTVDFAIAAIEGEKLGVNTVPDMLTVSFSTPDHLGHQVGAQSREIHDMYLRLDLDLKRFLEYIDKKFGMDNVVVFLTADHGAADIPSYVKSNTGFYSETKIWQHLNAALQNHFSQDSIIENVSNLQIFLNHAMLRRNKISVDDILKVCKENLSGLAGIYDIMSTNELGKCPWTKTACDLVKNGFHPRRSGDLLLMSEPGWLDDYSESGGTTHGSPFVYDTHVPMLWLGWKIPKGISYQRTEIPDIAPTLALMLGCALPNGSTGTPIFNLLDNLRN